MEVCNVEEEFEGFRECHEIHGRRVLLGSLPWGGVAICVALYRGVDILCKIMLVHEL